MVRATRTSLPADTDSMGAFTRWIAGCLPSEALVLDIGAGEDCPDLSPNGWLSKRAMPAALLLQSA